MMKAYEPVKQLEFRAEEALRKLIGQVPALHLEGIEVEPFKYDRGIDILASIRVFGRAYKLACEVKADGQPRNVREALYQLRNYLSHQTFFDAIPLFIAPYLSPEAREICKENNVGFLDLEGNARLALENFFIERVVESKPAVEKRELRSIFKPKSAQVLRVMLRDVDCAWKVADLANVAMVSLGHVSNVRKALLDKEWGKVTENGFIISNPKAVLEAWRNEYKPPVGKRISLYTPLHGSSFDDRVRHVLNAEAKGGKAILSSYSAAHWIAPYGRTGTNYLYADSHGFEILEDALQLSPATRGANINISIIDDEGIFQDAMSPAEKVVCTGLVQTYLDLANAGERGFEAAEHLRQEKLKWSI